MNRRDRFIQLADYTTLPAGSDAAPYFLYLHDGFDHGTYGQRYAGFKVYTAAAPGGAAASGVYLYGEQAQDMRFLAVGDVIYTRSVQNEKAAAGGQKNQWLARTVTAVVAGYATLHASADISTVAPLFVRQLYSGDDGGWIGVQDCQEVGVEVFVHSGGPVTVQTQYTSEDGTPTDGGGDRPISYPPVTVLSGAGTFIRNEGAFNRIRVGFQGAIPSIVTAKLLMRRGL